MKGAICGALVSVALVGFPPTLSAQREDDSIASEKSAALIADVRTEFECDIAVTGTPRFDEFSNAWLVAFTAAGPKCDDAAAALMARGRAAGAVFFRRPDLSQVKLLVADLRRTLRRGFSCPISIRGEPYLEEPSGYWVVSYVGSGADCGDAATELERLGTSLQIRFLRTFTHQEVRTSIP